MVEMTQQEKDIITGVVTNELGVINPTITKKIVENLSIQLQGFLNRRLINSIKEHLAVANSVNALSNAQELLTKCLQSQEEDFIQYEKSVTDNNIEIISSISSISEGIETLTGSVSDMLIRFNELQKESTNKSAKEIIKKDKEFKEKFDNHIKEFPPKVEVKKSPTTLKEIHESPKKEISFSDIVISDDNIMKPQIKKPQAPRKKKDNLIHRNLEQEHEKEKQESKKSNLLATYLDMKFSDLIKVAKEKQIKIPPRSKKDDIAMMILGD